MTPRIGVLISGRGSNLQSLLDAIANGTLHAQISVVISNREDAEGLGRARAAGIEAIGISHKGWASRDDYDAALADVLRQRQVDLVCLAGFMRVVGPRFLDAFPRAVLNIHPSLLPAFPGIDAQRQAYDHGVAITGVTVHFVDLELDSGPIILQRTVPVLAGDSPDTLRDRILIEEHRAYPEAVAMVLKGGWTIEGRRFVPAQAG